VILAALASGLLASGPIDGAYPGGDEVLGAVQRHPVREGESLIEIARDYDVGFNAISAANPGLDPFVPGTGAQVEVPTAFLVPQAAACGRVVVNLSEMRLYYTFALGRGGPWGVVTVPVGIGEEGSATPTGTYRVVEKETRPPWHVPASIRSERPELPPVVPPGPDNPLGTRALRLSSRSLLIHGTNKPWGVGRRVSHGCIRLYPEDITRLYRLVPVGTAVAVVREPVKVGLDRDRVYVEVHADRDPEPDYRALAQDLLAGRGALGRVDLGKLEAAIRERSGMPVDITESPGQPEGAGRRGG